jgi:hypothetical protein
MSSSWLRQSLKSRSQRKRMGSQLRVRLASAFGDGKKQGKCLATGVCYVLWAPWSDWRAVEVYIGGILLTCQLWWHFQSVWCRIHIKWRQADMKLVKLPDKCSFKCMDVIPQVLMWSLRGHWRFDMIPLTNADIWSNMQAFRGQLPWGTGEIRETTCRIRYHLKADMSSEVLGLQLSQNWRSSHWENRRDTCTVELRWYPRHCSSQWDGSSWSMGLKQECVIHPKSSSVSSSFCSQD